MQKEFLSESGHMTDFSPQNLHGKKEQLMTSVHQWCDPFSPSSFWQEEVARLAALQPQVDLLEKRLNELKGEKDGEEDPSAFLDADINAFKEHYRKVLEDLRARERQLQLGERQERCWFTAKA